MATTSKVYDALIIGSGPAGLSAALGLARQLYTAVVFDSQQYRNYPADRMHNVITWDHRPPEEFRTSARNNISDRYKTIEFRQARVETIRRLNDGTFEAVDGQQNRTIGKKVVLATGVTDVLPLEIKGFSTLWGKSIFHCLFCHGYEEAGGQSAGVLASGVLTDPNMVLHMAGMAASLAKDVVVYTNGDAGVAERMKAAADGKRVTVEPRKIVAIERKEPEHTEVLVHFGDGETREETFLVAVPPTEANGPFVEQLGLEVTEQGFIKTSPPFYATNVPGVFAIGDCATPFKAVPQAIAMGTFAAGGIAGQLGQQKL